MRNERNRNQYYSQKDGASEEEMSVSFYQISVVAQMVETHPQTLRMYERMGLLAPQRTQNNVRLYSDEDVARVRRIQHLTQELGVNLAGVEVVFKLLGEIERLMAESNTQSGDMEEKLLPTVPNDHEEPPGNSLNGHSNGKAARP